jgi:tight adherence protein C
MMSPAAGMLTCLTLALGLALAGSGSPARRSPRLPVRLDPYLRGLEPRATRLLETEEPPLVPIRLLDRLLRPVLDEGGRLVERCLGGTTGVARRLREAGLPEDVPRFRAEQMLWGLAGFAGCSVVALVGPMMSGGAPALAGTAAGILGLLGGVLGRDWRLTQQVERRQARMLEEVPALADLICLAVTAGEAPRAAIERVVARAHGELSRELGLVLADLRAGTSFIAALERLAARVPVPQVVRFVDGLVVAVERGTPLADVLRAQASDVREQHKRELIEAGGRREVYMLVPVVFMLMPVVVLFALYPGFLTLIQIAR